MVKPIAVAVPLGDARERYDAMRKGKPVPKREPRAKLPEEIAERFLDRFAEILAEDYKKSLERGNAV